MSGANIARTFRWNEGNLITTSYTNCAAIACDLFLRGKASGNWMQAYVTNADMVNLEKLSPANVESNATVIEKLELPGKHWKLTAGSRAGQHKNTFILNWFTPNNHFCGTLKNQKYLFLLQGVE